MRLIRLGLSITLFLATALTTFGAVNLMLPVPASHPVYAELSQLARDGMLQGMQPAQGETTTHLLTRYDFAISLIEPLERCAALVAVQESAKPLPEQRRRAEMLYLTATKLPPAEFDKMLQSLGGLLRTFQDDIEQLSPGLSHRADEALRKLQMPGFRPWVRQPNNSQANTDPVMHVTVTPNAEADSFSGLMSFLAPQNGGRTTLFTRSADTEVTGPSLVGTRPATSMEAAVDVAFGRFRVYGSLASLPGKDPAQLILRPDGTGKAMLGVEVNVARLKALDISGIFEFHIMRSGDQENLDTNTGAAGGIGLAW